MSKPVKFDLTVPDLKIQDGKIQVFSILQRTDLEKNEKGDGNPLIYLLKGHPKYQFRTGKDKQMVYDCINGILKNFVAEFFEQINSKIGVVLCPSGNALNMSFAKKLNSLAKKRADMTLRFLIMFWQSCQLMRLKSFSLMAMNLHSTIG